MINVVSTYGEADENKELNSQPTEASYADRKWRKSLMWKPAGLTRHPVRHTPNRS